MKRLSAITVLVMALGILLPSGVAANGKPIFAPGGATGVTAAAGDVCPFPLNVDILLDRSTSKIFLGEGGTPDHIIVSGFVLARFTNTATGESIIRNASGPALLVFHDDGSLTITGRGPGWLALFPTDEGGPSLTYFWGLTTFDISATGRISNLSTAGTARDLCGVLA